MPATEMFIMDCPFCGEKPSVIRADRPSRNFIIRCENERCAAEVETESPDAGGAVDQWNKRHR